ncbi:MAG: transporter substrate-binding domain-containing protein [Halopseudomonas aestusnigri]
MLTSILKLGCVFALLFTMPVVAQEIAQEIAHNKMGHKVVRLQVGMALPPYVINKGNSGAELDIIREALAFEGYRITIAVRENSKHDVMRAVVSGNELGGCYSKPYIFYRNVAISLSSRRLIVDDIEDLRGQRVIGTSSSSEALGVNFSDLLSGSDSFKEVIEAREQNVQLFEGHADFVVGDINVFNWQVENGNLPKDVNSSQSIAVHPIFETSPKYLAFRNQGLCEIFNRGLERLEQSGRYQEILNSYGLF